MNTNKTILCVVAAALLIALGLAHTRSTAAEGGLFQKYEYVTIRWAGRDNTHLIRSNGKVEFLGPILNKFPRPDRTDDRSFYMNMAVNAAAKEGFEVTAMTNEEVIMKRALQP